MRKRRRKIRRRKRVKSKRKKKKSLFTKHLDSPVSHKYTKVTTDLMLIIEGLFLLVCSVWAFIEVTARLYGWWGG